MKEPVDHVLRPQLPWRSTDTAITECGYDASKVKTISRGELIARFKDLGEQRTSILTCMTCLDTSRRWAGWDVDPRQAIEREISWEARGRYSDDGPRLTLYYELLAIAELVETHRAEFDETIDRLKGRAAWQATKAEAQKKHTKQRTRGRSF
jgi:hypothetical protein